MNNDELLQKIGEMLEPINKRLEGLEQGQERLAGEVQTIMKDQEGLAGEVQTIKKDMATTDALQSVKTELLQKMSEETKDIAGFFHETWERMDTESERIAVIEDHLGLETPTKNN